MVSPSCLPRGEIRRRSRRPGVAAVAGPAGHRGRALVVEAREISDHEQHPGATRSRRHWLVLESRFSETHADDLVEAFLGHGRLQPLGSRIDGYGGYAGA